MLPEVINNFAKYHFVDVSTAAKYPLPKRREILRKTIIENMAG